jgi:4-amino-4-deoxy-L-arabinose transferase-like glycosyltransferase
MAPNPPANRRFLLACTTVIFLIAFVVLSKEVNASGIAAAFGEPISHGRAQDESIYVNAALRMGRDGGWLTPRVMGRLFLFKPPLLVWLSAASIKIFGTSLFSVRLPALVFGALGIAGVFAWCARLRSFAAGTFAAGLLLASPLWKTFSRLCYTDVLAASLGTLALLFVAFDPLITRWRTRIMLGVFGGLSILAKSAAGVLPFAALFLYCVCMLSAWKFLRRGVVAALLIAVGVAGPWHIYQTFAHRQWFWADYVSTQLIGVGLHSDRQNGVFDRPFFFYLERLGQIEPVLAMAFLAAIINAVRLRRTPPRRNSSSDLVCHDRKCAVRLSGEKSALPRLSSAAAMRSRSAVRSVGHRPRLVYGQLDGYYTAFYSGQSWQAMVMDAQVGAA